MQSHPVLMPLGFILLCPTKPSTAAPSLAMSSFPFLPNQQLPVSSKVLALK